MIANGDKSDGTALPFGIVEFGAETLFAIDALVVLGE